MTAPMPRVAGFPLCISTELAYNAFPFAARDSAGRNWVAYSSSGGHVSSKGDVRLRTFNCEGVSEPMILAAPLDGYGIGVGGLAADPAELGGRLWLATVRAKPVTGATATDYTTSVRSFDPETRLFGAPADLPALAPGQTVGSGLHVRPDGELLAVAYGAPSPGAATVAKFYAYNRETGAWSIRSTRGIPNRQAQEPTLLTMADGRLMMLLRSDNAAPYNCDLHAAISPDAGLTWGTPYRILAFGSGLPNGYVLPSGEIAVTFRDFSQPTNPSAAAPPGITTLSATGVPTWAHYNILNTERRYLYGQIVVGALAGYWWVYALEAKDGPTGSGASVHAVPIEWLQRPA